jgi:hypothetical protein
MKALLRSLDTNMSTEAKRTLEVVALIVGLLGGISSLGGYYVMQDTVTRHEKSIVAIEQKGLSDKESLLKLTWQMEVTQRDVSEIKAMMKAVPR